jgi:hypothetical protein
MEHDDRIDKTKERGVHISLRCKVHPHLRWHTKNIGWIGARSIFFASATFPIKAEVALQPIFSDRIWSGKHMSPKTLVESLMKTDDDGNLVNVVECPCSVGLLEVV